MQAYKPANITVEQLMQIVDDLKENFSKLQIGLVLDFKFAHRDALLSIEDAFKVPVRLSEVDHLNPDRLLSLEEIENHYFLYDFDEDAIKRYFSSLALDILAEIIATRNSMMIKVLKSESGIKLSEVEANFKIAGNQSTLTTDGIVRRIKLQKYSELDRYSDALFPVACAAMDPVKELIYMVSGHRHFGHEHIVHQHDLPNTFEQENINGEIIYGFITASGHFLNRIEAAKWVLSKFPEVLSKPINKDTGWLTSSNIDWTKVKQMLSAITKVE